MNSLINNGQLWRVNSLELPRSLSTWIFAASLFLGPLNGLRTGSWIAYGDILFVLAGLCAFCERMVNHEKIYFSWVYLLIAVLISFSFGVNEYWPEHVSFEEYQSFIDANARVHAQAVFSQGPNFRAIFVAIVIFPQLFVFLRIRSYEEMRTLMFIWAAGALYGAIFAVLYCNGFFPSHYDEFWMHGHRARGLTIHPNSLGIGSALVLPVLVLFYIQFKNSIPRILTVLAAFIIWRAVAYSGSRTGLYLLFLLSAAMFFLMYFSMTRQARRWLIGFGVAVVAVYLANKHFGGPADAYSAAWRLENGAEDSDFNRSIIHQTAMDGFAQSPIFGQGFQWARIAHNVYLQMLQSAGLVGLVAYVMGLLLPFYKAWQSGIFLRSYEDLPLRNVLLAAIFGAWVSNWVQPSINLLNLLVPSGLLLYMGVMRADLRHLVSKAPAPR